VTGRPVAGLRIIGGGSNNRFLNQATASAANLEVRAGPVEATALGNLVIQAVADDRFADVAEARRFVSAHAADERVEPDEPERWAEARARCAAVVART
jgi:rhamnulokinase